MDWLLNPNTLWVLSSSILLGLSSGVLGSFALLRRRSLLGDALAHAALPGIGVAFILFSSKDLMYLMLGAVVAGFLGAMVIQALVKYTKIKEDAALGVVLSVFFAIGIVLLTKIQHSGAGNQSGLDKFLFGQAASMVMKDVQTMVASTVLICLVAILLFKEFKLLCFDQQFAQGIGFSPRLLDALLMILIVLLVVVGMQAVGVVLMAAMLITPAAAARLWTDNLKVMVLLAALTGAFSGAVGTWLSTMGLRLPTGPLIVIAASLVFAVSLVFAPKKGILASILRLIKTRTKVNRENALRSIYELVEDKENWQNEFSHSELLQQREMTTKAARTALHQLQSNKCLLKTSNGYKLTQKGFDQAHRITRNHRLWEMYLMHRSQIDVDHVHRDADDIEHFLSPQIIEKLEGLLKDYDLEMKLETSAHPLRQEARSQQ